MKHFDNFQAYRKDKFARLGIFDRTFKPWKKWEDVSLTDLCPCRTCDISKELSTNCHYYQMSGGAAEELTKKCDCCPEHAQWMMDVIEKLRWYEEHDERLKGD